MEDFQKELIKTIASEVYKDTGQQGLKQIGAAFGAMMEWMFQFAYPLRLGNEKRRLEFERNVKSLQQSFDAIPLPKVIEVAPELAGPLLQKLSYTSNEDIARLFINLLNRAANSDTASDAHPAFGQMVERLSVDEAKILYALKDKNTVPYLNLVANTSGMLVLGDKTTRQFFTDFISLDLLFPQNIPAYISNLLSMGVFSMSLANSIFVDNEVRTRLMALHEGVLEAEEAKYPGASFSWGLRFLDITSFGKLFIKACTSSSIGSPV